MRRSSNNLSLLTTELVPLLAFDSGSDASRATLYGASLFKKFD